MFCCENVSICITFKYDSFVIFRSKTLKQITARMNTLIRKYILILHALSWIEHDVEFRCGVNLITKHAKSKYFHSDTFWTHILKTTVLDNFISHHKTAHAFIVSFSTILVLFDYARKSRAVLVYFF